MKKIQNYLFFTLVITLIILTAWTVHRLNKATTYYNTYYNLRQVSDKYDKIGDGMIGKRFFNNEIQIKRYKFELYKEFGIVVVIGKSNCGVCIDEIRETLNRINTSRVIIRTIFYDNTDIHQRNFKKEYIWNYNTVNGDFAEQYKKFQLLHGPSIFLIELKNGKVLSCLINASLNTNSRKSIYLSYLENLFAN